MKRHAESPQAYLNDVDGKLKEILLQVRAVIRAQFPEIQEGIRHGMLDYPGLANLGAQKHHVALYVLPEALARHADQFPGATCGKSCLRLTREDQVRPEALAKLLEDVVETRASSPGGTH